MAKRKRALVFSKVEFGAIAGRCSVCHRPFESQVGKTEELSDAQERVVAMFEAHVCDENFSQAAARIVRETTSD